MTQTLTKSKNLIITKCIICIFYFGLCAAVNPLGAAPQRFAELMLLCIVQTMMLFTILITLIQPKQHTVYRRFGFTSEAFIRTDFRCRSSVCKSLSHTWLNW